MGESNIDYNPATFSEKDAIDVTKGIVPYGQKFIDRQSDYPLS